MIKIPGTVSLCRAPESPRTRVRRERKEKLLRPPLLITKKKLARAVVQSMHPSQLSQGGRVKSRLSEKTVVIRRDGSVQNEDDIRLINPLPSFNATPHRSSFDGICLIAD